MAEHVGGGDSDSSNGGGGILLTVVTAVTSRYNGNGRGVTPDRLLQANSEWFSWLLASVLGIVGIAASVVLVYVISLVCDKGSQWCFKSFYDANVNTSAARHPPSDNDAHRGLDRSRLDIADRKQIVKELFASETFLYGVESKTTSAERVPSLLMEKNKQQQQTNVSALGRADGDTAGAEAGIELRNMTTQDTSETDDTPIKMPKEVEHPTDDVDCGTSRDRVKEKIVIPEEEDKRKGAIKNDRDKDLEKGVVEKDEETLGIEEEGTAEELTGNECCICLAPYLVGDVVLRSKHCPHMFHATCCEDWILQKPVCPLCTIPMILDAEWEATAVSVLGQERYDALLADQREGREGPAIVSSA